MVYRPDCDIMTHLITRLQTDLRRWRLTLHGVYEDPHRITSYQPHSEFARPPENGMQQTRLVAGWILEHLFVVTQHGGVSRGDQVQVESTLQGGRSALGFLRN